MLVSKILSAVSFHQSQVRDHLAQLISKRSLDPFSQSFLYEPESKVLKESRQFQERILSLNLKWWHID